MDHTQIAERLLVLRFEDYEFYRLYCWSPLVLTALLATVFLCSRRHANTPGMRTVDVWQMKRHGWLVLVYLLVFGTYFVDRSTATQIVARVDSTSQCFSTGRNGSAPRFWPCLSVRMGADAPPLPAACKDELGWDDNSGTAAPGDRVLLTYFNGFTSTCNVGRELQPSSLHSVIAIILGAGTFLGLLVQFFLATYIERSVRRELG